MLEYFQHRLVRPFHLKLLKCVNYPASLTVYKTMVKSNQVCGKASIPMLSRIGWFVSDMKCPGLQGYQQGYPPKPNASLPIPPPPNINCADDTIRRNERWNAQTDNQGIIRAWNGKISLSCGHFDLAQRV